MPISVIDSTGLASPLTGLNNPTVVGNMTFNTSGSGVIFTNTTSGVLTNSTLNDYEIGNYTPADVSGAGLTFTSSIGSYTKVGRLVTVFIYVAFPITSDTNPVNISLPFTPYRANGITDQGYGGFVSYTTATLPLSLYVSNNVAKFQIYSSAGVQRNNAYFSGTQLEAFFNYQTAF